MIMKFLWDRYTRRRRREAATAWAVPPFHTKVMYPAHAETEEGHFLSMLVRMVIYSGLAAQEEGHSFLKRVQTAPHRLIGSATMSVRCAANTSRPLTATWRLLLTAWPAATLYNIMKFQWGNGARRPRPGR